MGGAYVPQTNRKRAPPPSALWTELDPGRGRGRGRGGGVVEDGGGSCGCQSALAAAAARTPGLRSHLSLARR